MTGAALPAALLCGALGLALSFARPRAAWTALAVLLAGALVASRLPIPPGWRAGLLLGCWAGVAAAALAVHLPGGLGPRTAVLLAADAGALVGATIAAAGSWTDFLAALPAAMVFLPGGWLARRGGGIAVKVVASWLLAVAILSAALPLAPVRSPAPDHMD